jgi:hypothetical protein
LLGDVDAAIPLNHRRRAPEIAIEQLHHLRGRAFLRSEDIGRAAPAIQGIIHVAGDNDSGFSHPRIEIAHIDLGDLTEHTAAA